MTNAPGRAMDLLISAIVPLARAMQWSNLQRAGQGIGDLCYSMLGPQRRIVERNLEIAFGDALSPDRQREIARESFRNLAKSALEFARLPYITTEELLEVTTFEGGEHLRDALEQKRGVLCYTGHFGNWELMAARAAYEGYPLTVIARNLHNSYVNRRVSETRRKVGMKVLLYGSAIRDGIRALRNNDLLAILADQDAGADALFVPFLGTLAASVAGPAIIARRTGAPVIPGFDVRGPDGRHRVIIQPPLELQQTDDIDADTWENTRRMIASVESMIRQYPEQWLWQHKRWRTRPPDDPASLYDVRGNGRR